MQPDYHLHQARDFQLKARRDCDARQTSGRAETRPVIFFAAVTPLISLPAAGWFTGQFADEILLPP